MTGVAVLLLAAGGSTRMRGGDKLLETLDGEPLLRRVARAALASRADTVIAVTGARRVAREGALAGLPVRLVHNPDWEGGMGASIAAGAAALANAPPAPLAALVLPADMPDIAPALLDRMIAALPPDAPRTILRPRTASGTPGNPVLFGAAHLDALMALRGDSGAREIVTRNRASLRYLDDAGEGVLTDLDTPEAWAAYRRAGQYGKPA